MSYRGLDLDKVRAISFLDLRNYLKVRDWAFNEVQGLNLFVFKKNGAELIISNDMSLYDRERRLVDALRVIEEVENKPTEQLITDISYTAVDVVRFRLGGPLVESGTIPIEAGINLFNGSKKALLASACLASDPQKYHARLQRADAESFINSCRIGQTENRSYVTTFLCPVLTSDDEQAGIMGGNSSYSRSVTTTLLKGASSAVSSISRDALDEVLTSANPIISANLCEAILHMMPSQHGSSFLEISASWSTKVAAPAISNSVSITADYFEGIENIAHQLRPQLSTHAAEFIGRVDALFGKADADGKVKGEVSVVFVDDTEELVKARVDLNSDEYQKALGAHGSNRHIILRGVLHRSAGKRGSFIKDVTSVEVLNQGGQLPSPNA